MEFSFKKDYGWEIVVILIVIVMFIITIVIFSQSARVADNVDLVIMTNKETNETLVRKLDNELCNKFKDVFSNSHEISCIKIEDIE